MTHALSTHVFVNHRLTTATLERIQQTGVQAVEIFCARQHLDYHNKAQIDELGHWFRDSDLKLHSLHSPMFSDEIWGRSGPHSVLDITEPVKSKRLQVVDEIKRALEVAEIVPARYLIQHIGQGRQMHDPRKLDAAFSSLEHLAVFAKARGVTIALENTPDELGSPSSLQHFITDTHLHDLKLCFDIGHAHMDTGVDVSFEAMRDRVATSHVHDNHGQKDEHLLPYEGTIDWDAALGMLSAAAEPIPLVLELKEQSSGVPTLDQIRAAYDKLEKNLEARRSRATRS